MTTTLRTTEVSPDTPAPAADAGARAPAGLPAALRRVLRSAFGIDLRSLALLRIALGVILLGDLVVRALTLRAHYTDAGVLPRTALPRYLFWPWQFSLHALGGAFAFEAALFVVAGAFALALLAGWRTRLATVASWVLLLSLQHRNPMVWQGGDTLLRLLLFWAMFLPLGALWSVDHRRGRSSAVPGEVVCTPASAALLLQVVLMYLTTAALKLGPDWYVDGNAIYYALNLDIYASPLGSYLLHFPRALQALTFGTILLEVFGPLLALISLRGRLRLLMVGLFMGFHLSIALVLFTGIFQAACFAAWLPFLPPLFWRLREPRHERLSAEVLAAHRGHRSSALATAAIVGAFYIGLRWCIATVPGAAPAPRWAIAAALPLGLDQGWIMFRRPPRDDGWFIVAARTGTGRLIDLRRDGRPVEWRKPRFVAGTYRTDRWRKYLETLPVEYFAGNRPLYLDYLCREWLARGGAPLPTVDLVFMRERTPPPGAPLPTPVPVRLERRSCPSAPSTVSAR